MHYDEGCSMHDDDAVILKKNSWKNKKIICALRDNRNIKTFIAKQIHTPLCSYNKNTHHSKKNLIPEPILFL